MSTKENSDLNEKMNLGGEYPNRAKEASKDVNVKRVLQKGQTQNMNDPNMAPVYAGPINRDAQIPLSAMMMVYAGPEEMNGKTGNGKKFSYVSSQRTYPNPKICSICGAQNQTRAKFCENCGNLLKD